MSDAPSAPDPLAAPPDVEETVHGPLERERLGAGKCICPVCLRVKSALAAYVRDLEGALTRAEGERDDARATVSEWRSGLAADWTGHMLRCARINGRWSCDPRCPSQRLAALEGALRGARQRVDEYDNRLCWCRHLRMFADSLHDNGCKQARAALAPPERP